MSNTNDLVKQGENILCDDAANRFNKKITRNEALSGDKIKAIADFIAGKNITIREYLEQNGFDTKAYFMDGDFTRQLLDACADKGIDVKGEKGVYEMFPYKVRISSDEEHAGEVYIDRKKAASCRPAYVAKLIQEGQAKLYAAPFKAASFMSELADAYETTCLRSGARIGSTQALNKIYKSMAPMARARKDYDMQAFAFDLARLYEEGPDAWVTKNGTQYAFGTSRDGASGIRVLSRAGVESFISTLRSLNSGNE